MIIATLADNTNSDITMLSYTLPQNSLSICVFEKVTVWPEQICCYRPKNVKKIE